MGANFHSTTLQYVQPQHSHYLSQAELVVVDEAAAIPLPLVKKLMGPYLLFLSSTINGYEGTGRSLSLKLIQQLREAQAKGNMASVRTVSMVGEDGSADADSHGVVRNAKAAGTGDGGAGAGVGSVSAGGRLLRELKLEVPIRYSVRS
jgi:N-acetyltransferase 10